MTSLPRSRRTAFAASVEVDDAALRRINSALVRLEVKDARNAMRRGLGRWSREGRRFMASVAPFGKTSSVEQVRGITRPNVHLKFNVATKVKGYSKGLVTWAGIGVKEIRGSYLTPHWYLGWVENGHNLTRSATTQEKILMKSRGERVGPRTKRVIGRVPGHPWMKKYRPLVQSAAVRAVEPEVEKAIRRFYGQG
jgi:hypothetical protein